MYSHINEAKKTIKAEENLNIRGDWSEVDGQGAEGEIVGKNGLGIRKKSGKN